MRYHSVDTMSVKDCQEMIMTGDYMMICRSKSINPLIKIKAKTKHNEFIDELRELFSSEDLSKLIDKDNLIMRLRIKVARLINLHEGLTDSYSLKSNPERIKRLDSQKKDI